jgi:hypothetical protein
MTKRIRSVHDLYGGGDTGNLLQGRYHTEAIYAWFQNRHKKAAPFIEDGVYRRDDHEWAVPYGVRYALSLHLTHAQIAVKFPWYVTWRSRKDRTRRLRKYFMSLPAAIDFVATRAQYADPKAAIVCRHGIDIPEKLRNKLPKPWKWCPRCMTARKYKRVYPEAWFYARIRNEVDELIERRLPVMYCPVCGGTNRDARFRRSNQRWVVRKFKRGVVRARRQKMHHAKRSKR